MLFWVVLLPRVGAGLSARVPLGILAGLDSVSRLELWVKDPRNFLLGFDSVSYFMFFLSASDPLDVLAGYDTRGLEVTRGLFFTGTKFLFIFPFPFGIFTQKRTGN